MPSLPKTAPTPVDARRAEICRTAAQIFRDRGYDATSVSDIARALGITKAGLYYYFESKEALLLEITNYGLDRVRMEVIDQVRGIADPEERLHQLLLRHARIATDGHGAVAQLTDEIRSLPPSMRRKVEQRMRVYLDLVRGTLVELRSTGRLGDVDPTAATFSIVGMILWLPRWFRQNGRLTQEQAAHEIAKLALRGVVRPAPAKRKLRRAQVTSLKSQVSRHS